MPAAVALVAVVGPLLPAPRVAGSPAPYCTRLVVYVKTDEQLREAERELRADPRVREVTARTGAENYQRFKEIFASRPELIAAARPEALPPSLDVVEAVGVDPVELRDELGRYGRADYDDLCASLAELSDRVDR